MADERHPFLAAAKCPLLVLDQGQGQVRTSSKVGQTALQVPPDLSGKLAARCLTAIDTQTQSTK